MDPLTVFPPEIVHQIWRHLEPADLLAARAVAPHWLASITDCPAAWVTDFSHDWTEFLAVKKAVRSWSAKNIRRQTVRNVRDCVFTEFAYYLLYGTGILEMFSPNGESIRFFHCPVSDLHRGDKCLLIGVDEIPKTSKDRTPRHRTIITDFVFNYLDDMFDTEIIASSPNGYSYEQNGEFFFSLGPDIPGPLKMPCTSDVQLHFLASCAISVHGFTVKTIQFFDAETKSFANLKTCATSPRWIPSVEILLGPGDYFSIIVEQRDFMTISVYRKNIPLFEDSYSSASFSSAFKCIFTEDYFVLSLEDTTVTAFKLTDFTKRYKLEIPLHFNMKSIKCESWSLVKSTFVTFNLDSWGMFDPTRWFVYRLLEISCKSATEIGSRRGDDTNVEPKLQLVATNSMYETRIDGGLSVSEFEFCPRYAFKILSPRSSLSENERLVYLLHFDL